MFDHRFSFPASCSDFPHLPRYHFRASLILFGIASSFHYLFQHRVRIFLIFLDIVSEHRLSFSASCSVFAYIFWNRVRIFLIFLSIVSEHLLSFSASCPTFIIFSGIVSGFSSFSSASCPSISYIFRHRVWISPFFTSIVSESLIFPGIVLGFLLVLKSWRLSSVGLQYWEKGQNCSSSGFFIRVHFTLTPLVLRTYDSLIHSLY